MWWYIYIVKKKIILWFIGTVVLGLIIGLVTYLVISNNNTDANEEQDDEIVTVEPFLRIDDIDDLKIYNDNSPYELNIKVTCNEDFIITTKSNNDNILINKNIITPNKVGKSIVEINVKSSSKEVIKFVNVEVLPSNISANFSILKNNEIPSNLFVGEEYILELNLSKDLIYSYEIETSENINNLQIINKENKKIKYKFKIINNEEIAFIFKYKDYTKTAKYKAYNYINNIDISFSNTVENNQILLYLFNNDYKDLANNDGIFNEIKYTINKHDDIINDFSLIIENTELAEIIDNRIIAKSEGITILNVIANDGSNYKQSYQIVIEKVKIQNLSFNNEIVDLKVDVPYPIATTYSPIYALSNLMYYYNNQRYTDSTISFNSVGTYSLKVIDIFSNLNAIITFNVIPNENAYIISFNPNFLANENAIFESDVLTINSGKSEYHIPFSYNLNSEIQVKNITSKLIFSSDTISAEIEQTTYNGFIISLKGSGEIRFTIYLKDNPKIMYTFKVVIV